MPRSSIRSAFTGGSNARTKNTTVSRPSARPPSASTTTPWTRSGWVCSSTRRPGRQVLTYGFEAHTDGVSSTREDLNLFDRCAARSEEHPREWRAGPRRGGVRAGRDRHLSKAGPEPGLYSRYHLTALVDIPLSGRVDVDARSEAMTGTAYALYRLTPFLSLTAGVAQGFRAPNVDDLTTFGDFGNGFDVPNSDLRPETSLNYEAGVRLRRGLSALHIVSTSTAATPTSSSASRGRTRVRRSATSTETASGTPASS